MTKAVALNSAFYKLLLGCATGTAVCPYFGLTTSSTVSVITELFLLTSLFLGIFSFCWWWIFLKFKCDVGEVPIALCKEPSAWWISPAET